jgi:hypothetical protein
MAVLNTTPTHYSPSFIRSVIDGARSIRSSLDTSSATNHESTSSFFYDLPGSGLKSTQQVNVDWSSFSNHTFFNSAEVNVNVAFDKIINEFPFDGMKADYERFFENLSGFEKWVFDNFPRNVGYLIFSGTVSGEQGVNGTHIVTKDYAGSIYPELSKIKSGQPIIDPGELSWTVEFHLFVPSQANGTQVVLQRISGLNDGYTYFLQPTASIDSCESTFVVQSGSYFMSASLPLSKGSFNHVTLVYNKDDRLHRLQTYVDGTKFAESSTSVRIGPFTTFGTSLTIGSGSSFNVGTAIINPDQTLSGALDEFRFFHSARSVKQINSYAKKTVFATDDLKLYYKFNEPSGTIGPHTTDEVNRIVLDSSGNSLHTFIDSTAFNFSLRSTGSIPSPITYERIDLSPILFTSFPSVMVLNTELLSSATQYDLVNPNLITRLIPQHYLIEGQSFDGFETQQGDVGNEYASDTIPGSGKLGSTQIMLTFLYIWAKFFDELKIFVDAFSKLNFVDYNTNETVPDNFLPQLYSFLGFKLPPLFLDASVEQYIDSENIEFQISRGAEPLKAIENQILRRTLVSMGNIVRSKGTLRSVKAFFRTMGIDPDNSFRIREFGGPTERPLNFAREDKIEPGSWLNFETSANLQTPFLTASRLEPGFPEAVGSFVHHTSNLPHGISDHLDDGLLTSGSWTYEAIYRFPPYRAITSNSQSLARLEVTGSNTSRGGITFNLVALNGSAGVPASIALYGRPSADQTAAGAPILMVTASANVFDGERWNVSFGRVRGDELGYYASSSYFIRAASDVDHIIESSNWFREVGSISLSVSSTLENRVATVSKSGTFIRIGASQPIVGTTAGHLFLNNTSIVTEPAARVTTFEGQLAQMRFWSKALSKSEWSEHVRNFKSLGVEDPLTNFNFSTSNSGSFGKLRLDVPMRQDSVQTDPTGKITLFDYSQNSLHTTGSNFSASFKVIVADIFKYSMISPYYDEAATNEKVRVRSYQDFEKARATPWAGVAPVYRIEPSEQPTDSTKFSIEFSLVDALNRDIISIFSTLNALDNVIGNPELVFSPDYPGLERLRDVYFNRLTDKLNFKSFFEFFRWFETSIGSFIDQLIPRKTLYFGTNFVIESHMLERPKFENLNNEIYLTANERSNASNVMLLQQIAGSLRKF